MNSIFGFLPQIGPMELIIILVILVLVLGPKRIPAAAKSVGHGFRNFKGALGSGGSGDEDQSEKPDKSELHEKSKTRS